MARRGGRSNLGLGLCMLASVGFLSLGCSPVVGPGVRFFKTNRLLGYSDLWLSTRPVPNGHGAFLFFSMTPYSDYSGPSSRSTQVVRYEPASGALREATLDEWNDCETAKCRCRRFRSEPNAPWSFDAASHQLCFNGNPIHTSGNVVISVGESPSAEYLAVLSVSEVRRESTFALAVGAQAYYWRVRGPFFHEVFNAVDGSRVVGPVEFPIRKRKRSRFIRACWTSDERFIVYADGSYPQIGIADLAEQAPEWPTVESP